MDGSLRELERRARGSADAADVHAYVQALVRSDAIPPDRAPLLAWLAAEVPRDPDELARGLAEHGRAVVARGALAAAEALLDVWHAHAPAEHALRPVEALAAARAWLACPCESHAAEATIAAEAAIVAGDAVQSMAIDAALDPPHDAPVDECELDALDPALTCDPRAAFDDVADVELLARLRRASDAGEPLDHELVEECRERAGEEAVLEATTGALRGSEEPETQDDEPPRRGRDAPQNELQALDRRTVTLLLVDPVAALAAAAAAACNAEQLPDDRWALLRMALQRATSVWTASMGDYDPSDGDEPLVLGSALVAYPALASVVLDALRRWVIELPPAAVAGLGPSPTDRPRARPTRARRTDEDEGLPRDPTPLSLLAWLGHPGAALRLRAGPPPNDLEEWARGLSRFGATVCGHAALAAARAALDAIEERAVATSRRRSSGPRCALATLEAWLERPEAPEAEAARAALDARVDAMCESSGPEAKAEELAALALELALATGGRLGDASAGVHVACAEVVGPLVVRRAVARALVPSLLAPDEP